jgi:hypothetical protein
MLENQAKGSFGAFSSYGRITAESFINIKRKDKILNPKGNKGNKQIIIDFLKRNKYQNIEGDLKEEEVKEPNDKNLDDSEIEDVEEESDIFQINEEEEKKKKENLAKNKKPMDSFSLYHRTNEDAYKFHDLHMSKIKKKQNFTTPNCTKYYPNKNLVCHRSPSGPKWETMTSRKPLANKTYGGSYLTHEDPLKNITNCFINMDKQTMRGDVINCNNVRINTAKPFISKDKKNKSTREFNKLMNDSINNFKDKARRIKSGKDYNKRINLEMNKKWTNKEKIPSPLQTLSTIENQKRNSEKSNKSLQNIKVLTTELTESANKVNINTNDTNFNKSNISSKIENHFEEQKNMDINEKIDLNSDKSDIDSSELNDSYHKFKNLYTKQLKSHQKKENLPKITSENSKRSSINIINANKFSKSKINDKFKKRPKTTKVRQIEHKPLIKGPEFDKIIPREYYDNLYDNGLTLIPFSINNYTQVRERPLSVVVYKRRPIFKKRINNFKGMEIDQYKNIYNFIQDKCYVPNFNKMNTRPMDDGTPLPVFMKGVVSRDGCNITTDTSLKMNNFADGKIRGNYNTFLPKKSFNKIVNLNLMNSNKLIDYLLINKKEALQNNDDIIKSLKFYSKNFKDLLKETSSGKFDNVTYKTIQKKYEIYEKELQNFKY